MAATFVQLLPSVVVFAGWRGATDARRWIALWCLVFFLSDGLQALLALAYGTNLWVFIYVEPVEDALLLWALSYWQTRPVTRMALRIAIPLVIASYVLIAIVAGELESYKTFSGPFRSLMIMIWTAFTLITNIARAPERVWTRDWLWTCLGVLLYFGMFVVTEPVIAAMPRDQVESMFRVYNVRAMGDIVAFILIWRGMRCPLPRNSSGST